MSVIVLPSAPSITLENVSPRPFFGYNQRINAFEVTGTDNIKSAINAYATHLSTVGANGDVAVDIETKGTDTDTWWQITCVTVAFHTSGGIVSVLLDPLRDPEHPKLLRRIIDLSSRVTFHNSSFDIPPLVAHGLFTLDDVNKVWDTLVLARMVNTSAQGGRTLEDLSNRYRIVPDDGIKMAKVFAASGFGAIKNGFAQSDINSGTYRDGAMSDTVVTLRLLPVLEQVVTDVHDVSTRKMPSAVLDTAGARDLITKMQRVNQIALRRAARGYKTDPTFLDKYVETTAQAYAEAESELKAAGLEPGRGDKLIEHLRALGQLPDGWPMTKGGRLSADKKAMELLINVHHPLAAAHRAVAETDKIRGYLEKVNDQVRATGRLHPMIGVLSAAASGRMSVSGVELQQFPKEARGILVPDEEPGWTSVDWSSIEPVTMAICAGDNGFLNDFYDGGDLYLPVARAAGLIPLNMSDELALKHKGRKIAKVILLAAMYGQGAKSLATSLTAATKDEYGEEKAKDLKNKMRDAMPTTFSFMRHVMDYAELNNCVSTIMGRVLNEDAGYAYRGVNHFCQGSAADILYESTLAADRAGLADHIHLWMHDELVVDTVVDSEINQIMQTPPSCLLNRQRTERVMLRTDMNPMGMEWQSV